MLKKYISRPLYIEKIRPFIGKNLIKVLIGQRRVGKSYVMLEIMDLLHSDFKYKKTNIIYINKELAEHKNMLTGDDLLAYIAKAKRGMTGKKALFIDEIQEIEGFEKTLRSIQALGGWEIYISGSNAHLLSSELATFLSGRYIEVTIYPLSYEEFLRFHKLKLDDLSFEKYVHFGGLPYLIHLDLTDDVAYQYLRTVFDSILLKDLVQRYGVRNVAFLNQLVMFLADNIGSLVSSKKISDFLKNERINISPNQILDYLEYINAVFLAMQVKRKSLGKKIFEVGNKHYFLDIGIRNAITSFKPGDIAKILENLVFVHLKRLGYEVHIGKLPKGEIDFIATKNNIPKYIQVAYQLKEEKTIKREFENLLSIPDNYEKIVITMDRLVGKDYKGIKIVNAIDFLYSEAF